MPNERPYNSEIAVKIPFSTIVTVLLTIAAVHFVSAIAPLFFPVFFGVLLAVALTPALTWLEKGNCPRWLAISLVTLCLGVLFFVILALVVPPLVQQVSSFIQALPELRAKFLNSLPQEIPLRRYFERGFSDERMIPKIETMQQLLGAGNMILGGLTEIILIFVFTIYLMIDGPRVIRWLAAFFSPSVQRKIEDTRVEVAGIISSYIFGQLITSAASFVFVLIAMAALQIPNALLVATLAFVFDILPVLGFFLSVIPAMLFAATVSFEMPFIIFGLFVLYHGLENYVLVPWVYGNRLRISSLVVFFSLLAAGLVAGVEGAVAALPIIASYPIIERVWLKRYLSERALKAHAKLEA